MSVPPEPPATPATPGGQMPLEGLPVPVIPDHTLIRKIAEGSYGEIWLARNIMGTLRAVKILYRKRFAHERPYEREYEGIQKFEPISRSHEGFVDILHMGRNDAEGYFYYVMELGDDRDHGQEFKAETYLPKTLASEVIGRGRLPIEECLHLALTITDALRQLHEHGLTHRDIKPSNIIFVNGTPKLADIGLVADIGHDRSYVGTEGFIAPEGPGTPQADLFSLGKVLYEMSTGKDRNDFPELPDNFDSFPDAEAFREFNEVVIRACHGDLSQRYSTARKMYAELAVIINGDSVRRLRHLERRLAVIRHLGLVALLLVVIGGVIGYPVYRAYQMRQEARERLIGSSISEGTAAMKQGLMPSALSSFAKALQLTAGMGKREEDNRMRCASTLAQCPKLVQMVFATSGVTSVEFHPHRKQILVTQEKKAIYLYDIKQDSTPVLVWSNNLDVAVATFSRDGKYIASAGYNNNVRIWDAEKGGLLRTLRHTNGVNSVQFSPDGEKLVTGTSDHRMFLWSFQGDMLAEFKGNSDDVHMVCFSPDQKYVASACNDGYARVWDIKKPDQPIHAFKQASWVQGVAFSLDSKLLATSGFDRQAHVWNLDGGIEVIPAMPHEDGVRCVLFSPDGRFLLTASFDGVVHLWDAMTHLPVANNSALQNSDRVLDAVFNPEGNQIIMGCNDGSVRIWDYASSLLSDPETVLACSTSGAHFAKISSDSIIIQDAINLAERRIPLAEYPAAEGFRLSDGGRWLVAYKNTTNDGSCLYIWDSMASTQAVNMLSFSDSIDNIFLSSGELLGVVSQKTNLCVVDISNRNKLVNSVSFRAEVVVVTFNNDNTRIYVGADRWLSVLDPRNGSPVGLSLYLPQQIQGMTFSPKGGDYIICYATRGGDECFVQKYNSQTHVLVGPLMRHRDGVLKAIYNSTGSKIATGSEDFTARVWNANNSTPITPPLPHSHQVTDIGFSPDGRWLLTVSRDRKARLWNADSGEPLGPPMSFPCPLYFGRFLEDGYHLAVGGMAYAQSANAEDVGCWNLSFPQDHRPVQDWQAIAELLSGSPLTSQQANDQQNPDVRRRKLKETWLAMKAKYPEDFRTTEQDVIRWHELEALKSEKAKNMSAVRFHLEWMLKHDPANAFAQQRLAENRNKLKADTAK